MQCQPREHPTKAVAPTHLQGRIGSWAFGGYVIVACAAAYTLYRIHPWPGPGARGASDPYAYGPYVLLAFVPYGLVALAWIRTGPPSRRLWWAGVALIGLAFVLVPPVQSHDVFQYVAYGRLQLVHEANPYLVSPGAFPTDPVTHLLGWPEAKSVYGPAWLLPVGAIVAVAGGSIPAATVMLKAFVWLLVLATGRAIEASIRGEGGGGEASDRGRLAGFLFVCNPLVIGSEALGGHADAAIALGFALAVLADRRGRERWAALALSMAVLVKIWAVLPFGVYVILRARRGGVRSIPALLMGPTVLATATFAPFWEGPRTLFPALDVGLRTSSSFAGAVQAGLYGILSETGWASRPEAVAAEVIRVTSVTLLAVMIVFVILKSRIVMDVWDLVSLVVAAFVLATPWYLPWYSVALLALGLCLGGAPAAGSVALSVTSSLSLPVAAGGAVARFGAPLLAWRQGNARRFRLTIRPRRNGSNRSFKRSRSRRHLGPQEPGSPRRGRVRNIA